MILRNCDRLAIIRIGSRTAKPSPSPTTQHQKVSISGHWKT